jgi:hypothetical protein
MIPTVVTAVETPASVPSTPVSATRSKKLWALGVGILVVVTVAALVVALVSKSTSAIPAGSETATIHISISHSGQPSFSGTVAGLALTGTVSNGTSVSTGPGSGTLSLGGVLFDYKGSLGGTAYVLHVSLDSADNASPLQNGQFSFRVTGTYGSEPVKATAQFEVPSSGIGASETVLITGTIGGQFMGGTATASQDGDGAVGVTAKLTVSAESVSPS